jgi:hypothetical protein
MKHNCLRAQRGIEPLICLLVVLCASAAVVTQLPGVMRKARATEMMILGAHLRSDAVLDYAEAGAFGLRGAPAGAAAAAASRAQELERELAAMPQPGGRAGPGLELGGGAGRLNFEHLKLAAERAAEQRNLRFRSRWDGQRGVVTGEVPNDTQPLRLSFVPAVAAEGLPATLRLLCGDAAPPAGWFAVRDATPQHVPPGMMFSVCRTRGTRP